MRWRGGAYKLNFDLHRAGGLWLWAMLFVLAWSSVAFNLNAVYSPVMKLFFATDDGPVPGPRPKADQIEPGIPWRQAHRMAQAHMAAEGRRLGFEVVEPQALSYDPHKALYRYSVRSSADVREKFGSTRLWFDANTGELRRSWLPSGRHAGDTITTWLVTLHIAQVWGCRFGCS